MKKLLILVAICTSVYSFAQPVYEIITPRDNPNDQFSKVLNQCNRNQVIKDYFQYYQSTEVSSQELGWTGNVDNCVAGTISEVAMTKTLERINYFRRLVGIPNGVIFNSEKNTKCQQAVLMMQAAGTLDHYPTMDWECSSEGGIQAAGKSNLSYGRHSAGSIPQYIQDSGTNNGAVGHRRWILFPKAYEFGFGSSNWGTALWVIGGTKTPDSIPDFVAYPSPGYFPKPLLYQRWSFSKAGAKFNEAIINMTDKNGNDIPLKIEEIENGYGDNTLVWVPEIITWNTIGEDLLYHVEILNVQKGEDYLDYSYDVMAIDMVEETNNHPSPINICEGENEIEISLNPPYEYTFIKWNDGSEGQSYIAKPGIHIADITDLMGCIQKDTIEVVEIPKPDAPSISGNIEVVTGNIYEYSTNISEKEGYAWEILNGEIISGQNSDKVEVKWNNGAEGTLCVSYIGSTGCFSNEGCIEVSMLNTGTKELIDEITLVYPNPFVNELNFKHYSKATDVQIFNTNGLLVLKQRTFSNINTTDWKPGIYYVKYGWGDMVKVEKLIKI